MRFEAALRDFQIALEEQYGVRDAVVKIALEPKLFEQVVWEVYAKTRPSYDKESNKVVAETYISFRPTDAGEFLIYGTQILARQRDKF